MKEESNESILKKTHSKKVILVSENDLFLTLSLHTSSARNENLRPLLRTNIYP